MILEFYSFYDNLFANILSLSDHVFVSFFYRYMHNWSNDGREPYEAQYHIGEHACNIWLPLHVCMHCHFFFCTCFTIRHWRQGKARQVFSASSGKASLLYLGHLQTYPELYRYRFNRLASTVLKETILGFYRFCYILFVSFLYLTDTVLQDFSTNTSTYLEIPNTDMLCRWACWHRLASSTWLHVITFPLLYTFDHQALNASLSMSADTVQKSLHTKREIGLLHGIHNEPMLQATDFILLFLWLAFVICLLSICIGIGRIPVTCIFLTI
jgi:hypothetical protein